MKCPMSNYVMERESGKDEVLLNDCFKEECAWWDEDGEVCWFYSIGKILESGMPYLKQIVDKMPHELQFRK